MALRCFLLLPLSALGLPELANDRDSVSLLQYTLGPEAESSDDGVPNSGGITLPENWVYDPSKFFDDGKAPLPAPRVPPADGATILVTPQQSAAAAAKAAQKAAEDALAAAEKEFVPTNPVPIYSQGEATEIISLDNSNIGEWMPAVIEGFGANDGTYTIKLPTVPEGSNVLQNVPGQYLRKGDRSDATSAAVAEEATAYAANIKRLRQAAKPPPPPPPLPQGKNARMVKWLQSKGLMPSAAGNVPMQTTPKPTTTTTTFLTAAMELSRWLETTEMDAATKAMLVEKANSLPPDISVDDVKVNAFPADQGRVGVEDMLKEAANLREQQAEASNISMEEQIAADPVINGSYKVTATGQSFEIHNLSCMLFVVAKPDAKGEMVSGALLEEGEWLVANLSDAMGRSGGSLRVKKGEDWGSTLIGFRGTKAQVNYGQKGWGGNLLAKRFDITDDELPGKCVYKNYGCRCENGHLKQLDIFYASVGEDVEIFSPTGGAKWYPATVIGHNPSTLSFSIIVPAELPKKRIYVDVPPDYLRRSTLSQELLHPKPVTEAPLPMDIAAQDLIQRPGHHETPSNANKSPDKGQEAEEKVEKTQRSEAGRAALALGALAASLLAAC